jgi:MFS family permease
MNTVIRARAGDKAAFASAFFLSAFGYEVLFFAMTLRVYDISRRAINVGIFAAVTFLPKLLSPLCGAIVDRAGPRRTMAACAAATALAASALPFIPSPWALYALWLPLSFLFIALGNARTVLMTRVVGSSGYLGGNSLAFTLLNAARLSAPLLAGSLSKLLGTGVVVFAASAIYLLCCAASLALDRSLYSGSGAAAGRSLGEGFSRIRESKPLKRLIGVSMIRNLFVGFYASLLVVLVKGSLGRDGADYGLALTAAALGSLCGGLAGPLLAKAIPRRILAGAGLGIHFASLAALGALPSFPAALACLAIGSLALYAASVVLHAMRDSAAELATRGRVYGANTAIQTTAQMLSMIAGSLCADLFGAGPVFLAGGAAALAALAAAAALLKARPSR